MPPVLFAGVPVADYPAARGWYERLFGRGPDMVPNQTEVVWQVAEGGWVYVVADAERAGRALVTVIVDDLDGLLAGLVVAWLRSRTDSIYPTWLVHAAFNGIALIAALFVSTPC